MATVQFSIEADMSGILGFYSGSDAEVIKATSTLIEIISPYYTLQKYTGSFKYSGGYLVGGTLTGFAEYDLFDNSLIYKATGFSLSVLEYAYYSENDMGEEFVERILRSADKIIGSSYSDTLAGYSGNDSISGGDGNDSLNGGDGNDSLNGGDGNDTLAGGSGSDSLNGGDGNDWIVWDGADVYISGGSGIDTLYVDQQTGVMIDLNNYFNFENLIGGSGADSLVGTNQDNVIKGGAGNDTIDGGLGNDTIDGGSGDDIVIYDVADPTANVKGGAGVDTLDAGAASSDLSINLAKSYPDFEKIIGGMGNDTLAGNASANILEGGDGNDSIYGGAGNDTLIGGTGDDILDGGAGADVLSGGAGNDTIVYDAADKELSGGGDIDTLDASRATSAVKIDLSARYTDFENLTGGAGSDKLTGNAEANIIIGGKGSDTIDGGSGSDTLIGGSGNDVYVVTGSDDILTELAGEGTDTIQTTLTTFDLNDTANIENLIYTGMDDFTGTGNSLNNAVTGGSGDDSLSGGDGNDTLTGNGGNDTLAGGSGDDKISGGSGDDVIIYDAADKATNVSGGAGKDTLDASGAAGATIDLAGKYTDIENIIGSSGDDFLKGSSAANILDGADGNDSIYGGSGNDTLIGGDGNDTLDGGAGADSLSGGGGNDIYVVDNNGDIILAEETDGGSADMVKTMLSAYTLDANIENLAYGGSGAFSGTGNILDNVISGGSGKDTLYGGAGDDTLNGGAGDDIYIIDDSGDRITELAKGGTDTIRTSLTAVDLDTVFNVENLIYTGSDGFTGSGNSLNNAISGGSGDDNLSGGAGNDTLIGGDGNDTLDGGAGSDRISGGDGDDTVIYDAKDNAAKISGGGGTDTLDASGATAALKINLTSQFKDFENITGGDYNDSLIGNSFANTLYGGAGDDTLDGGAGADSLSGGAGNDTFVVDNLGDTIFEADDGGTDTVRTKLTICNLDNWDNVENLTYTGGSAFVGSGNDLDNYITGGSGNDTLTGGAGNDTLFGGAGIDSLMGGIGNDVYIVDSSADKIVEADGDGIDTVRTSLVTYALTNSAYVENLTYTGSANFKGSGNDLDNYITGGSGNDTLTGGVGNDTLFGGAGIDSLVGGAGNDTYIVDSSTDKIVEADGDGIDTVRTGLVTYALTNSAYVENLTYIGTSDFTGSGNSLDNYITGGDGNDSLYGGAGNDTLTGGVGNDTFIFSSVESAGNDVISDYSIDDDTIKLSDYDAASFFVSESDEHVAITDGTWTLVLASIEYEQASTGIYAEVKFAGGNYNLEVTTAGSDGSGTIWTLAAAGG